MKNIQCIILLVIFYTSYTECRNTLPYLLRPGQSFVAPDENSVYWVFSEKQVNVMLATKDSLMVYKIENQLYKNKTDSLDKIVLLATSKTDSCTSVLDVFHQNMVQCSENAKEAEIKMQQWKNRCFVSVPVFTLLGAVLTIILIVAM
jgi:hypothetical protein